MTTKEIIQKLIQGNDNACTEMMALQVMDEQNPNFGGYYSHNLGYASPSHVCNAPYILHLAIAYFTEGSCYYRNKDVFDRLLLACEFQKKCQRESGFIDIPQTNFDSPPDTAFAIFLIAMSIHTARMSHLPEAKDYEDCIAPFVTKAAVSIANDGFHTPNHRWMVVGALALSWELYPTLPLMPAIESYLAEGIDVNEDGFFCERSTGTYMGEESLRLTVASEVLEKPEIKDLIRRAMQCISHYLYEDYSVDTSISGRQDAQNSLVFPTNTADNYLYLGILDQNGAFTDIALHLLAKCGYRSPSALYLLLRNKDALPETLPQSVPLQDTDIFMQDAGVYRKRKGKLGVTIKAFASNVMKIRYGQVTLSEVRLFAPYFGGAKFVPVEMEQIENGFRLKMISQFSTSFLPGYMKPLGYEREIRGWGYNRGDQVASLDLPQYTMLEGREIVKRPEFTFWLTITEQEHGYRLSISTEGGLEQVPFMAEFLFLPGGRAETEDVAFSAKGGETVFLKKNSLTYCAGNDYIRISGGNDAHRNTNNSEGAGGMFRVAITDFTQVHRDMDITFGHLSAGQPM